MKLSDRVDKLEQIVAVHLQESGSIQTNLKWNTVLTGIILTAVIGQFAIRFFFPK